VTPCPASSSGTTPLDTSEFRAALDKTRRSACREGANWDRVQAVMRAIDEYAEAATGNREYFWDRPVGIGRRR
jgi:hypothetical protein